MDNIEFKKIQSELGVSNKQMAESLAMSVRNIEDMRAGRRNIQPWTCRLLEYVIRYGPLPLKK